MPVWSAVVQSLNSHFFPPNLGAEPRRAKRESRITCMRMLRTPPFFPPNRGKTIFGSTVQIRLVARQFLHKTCQLIPNQWNFTSATLNDIRFVFFTTFYYPWSKKMSFIQSARRARAEKGIARHIDESSAPSNFWLVRFERVHASYPGLSFRPPGFSSYMGREERRVQGLN